MSNKLAQAVDLARLGVKGFQAIATITHNTTDDKLAAGMALIRDIVATVEKGTDGKISLEASELAVEHVLDRQGANDATINSRADRRWSDGEPTDD